MAKEPKTVVATDTKIKELLAAKTGFNNISLADFRKFLKTQKDPSGKGYTLAQIKKALRTATPSAVRDAVSSPIREATPSPARSATPSPARSATPSGKIKTGKQADDLSAAIKGAKKALTKAKTRAENAAEEAGADYKSSKRRKPSKDVELAASSKKDIKKPKSSSKRRQSLMTGTYDDLKEGLSQSLKEGLSQSLMTGTYDDLKEGLKTRKKSGAKDSAERALAEKKETFGQRFAKERKAAKKRGDELTHVFTYKGKKYNTRIVSEEKPKTRVKPADGKGRGAVEITNLKAKANKGALVSRPRKGHTDFRKGGLFK